MHTFTLSNTASFTVYASPWQPVFYDWAFNYPLTEDRWNPEHLIKQCPDLVPEGVGAPAEKNKGVPIPDGAVVDVLITHGPPKGHLDKTATGFGAGCPHLLAALDRVRPRLHCFGHIHEAWGAEIIKWRTEGEDPGENGGRFGEVGELLGSWASGGQTPNDFDALERHANYLDVSRRTGKPFQPGKETLLINSCIMDLQYEARGSAWLVDIDLPRAAS
jgi:hypothetical protein